MKRILICTLGMLFAGVSAFAQADLLPIVNVKLNKTESITLKQLKARVDVYQRQMRTGNFTVEQKKEILDGMIDEKLIVQAAQKAGLVVTDSQANQAFLDTLAQQVGRNITEQEFAAIVRQQTGQSIDAFFYDQVGMNVAEYKSFLKNQLIAQQYIISQKRSELQNVAPTDAEIRSFFEINKANFVQSDILKLFLVVVPKGKDASSAKKEADKLYADLKNKKAKIEEVKAKSAAANSVFQAGDILVSKNAQAAQQLGLNYDALLELFKKDKNFLSEVTETDDDFQFYTIREKYEAKMLGLSDVVQPDQTVTVYEYIKTNLAQQKQQEFLVASSKEITSELRKPENFQMLKSGEALDKLLDW
ncbi:MAG: peptidylprolyl isomerase [Bacteroides sp.]|nr:peptidylprolyl isomerase [Prevotella sp.]MCM1408640.1 peptidylprolyl isomerase [Treponema brennaborense]MCM1470714.1 peptidylprolyl isomerase [Bacteroides sp.]